MADLAKLVEELSALTVMEAADLSKMLEEKWGVSAAAAVAVAAPGAGAAAAEERVGMSAEELAEYQKEEKRRAAAERDAVETATNNKIAAIDEEISELK